MTEAGGVGCPFARANAHSDARAFLITHLRDEIPLDDLATASRALGALTRLDLDPLLRAVTRDPDGRPVVTTPEDQRAHQTWSAANVIRHDARFLLEHVIAPAGRPTH